MVLFFFGFCFVLLVCVFVFVPLSCCFYYNNFLVLLEVWEDCASSFVLFPQDSFGKSGSFMAPYKL